MLWQAFAFINLARLAVPVRLGLAISTVPWAQKAIVDKVKRALAGPSNMVD